MSSVAIARKQVEPVKFNAAARLPFELRLQDFQIAMQDVYDFFYDVNTLLTLTMPLSRRERGAR